MKFLRKVRNNGVVILEPEIPPEEASATSATTNASNSNATNEALQTNESTATTTSDGSSVDKKRKLND